VVVKEMKYIDSFIYEYIEMLININEKMLKFELKDITFTTLKK